MSRRPQKLPPDSVASLVVPAWSGPKEATPRRPARAPVPGSIGSLVLGGRTHGRIPTATALLVGLATAVALHVALVGPLLWRPAERPAQPAPAPLVVVEHEVDLTEPVAPEPAPPPPAEEEVAEPEPVDEVAEEPPSPAPEQAPRPSAEPPPPAQAAKAVASDAPDEPVDFTGFDIATGDGPRYAGGVTASSGTNTDAVHTPDVDPNAEPDRPQGEGSLARPVTLPARNWDCSWPSEADNLGIDEQVVVIRATVTADGRPTSVSVLADPGHGFGEAALRCAREARFLPARDRKGVKHAATSPPVRVRFTR